MKKIFTIILGLFLVIGFAGCNSDGSEINIDMDELISNPTNLRIVGDTLSWDEVTDASGYIVYANDEEVDKVKTNSFDFSSLSGDVLVFQVRTRAPRGMQDSALSVKLAFVANKTEEIASVKLALADSVIPASPEFAEELVNKGMVSEDVQAMLDELDDFMEAFETETTFEGMIASIRDLVAETENIEALVSALVKAYLVEYLEYEILVLEEDNEYYEDEKTSDDSWYYPGELQSMIDANEVQIDTYQDLIDQIEDDADAIVLAITSTINYFISIEEMISDDLVSLVDNLTEVEDAADLNVDELVDIKDEIVTILLETMPTVEEMVLVLDVMDLITSLSGATVSTNSAVENYKGKMAAQSLYTLEAFINFLDTIDKAFFEEVKTLSTDENITYPMLSAELSILGVIYFDKFYDANQDLLDTIEGVFTEEEQEALFDEYIDGIDQMEGEEYSAAYGMLSNLDFQKLLDLKVIFEDSFGELLDVFVERDGEIIRQLAIVQNFSWYGLTNYASGIEYATNTEVREAEGLANLDLLTEVFILVNTYVQSIDASELDEMTNFLLNSIFEGIITEIEDVADVSYDELPFTEAQALAAQAVLATSLELANEDILEFLQAAMEYVVDEDVWQEYKVVLQDTFDYFAEEYGDDYRDGYNAEYYDDDYDTYAMLIFSAGIYDDFMTSRNRGTLDDILEVVFDTMNDEDIVAITGLVGDDITAVEDMIVEMLDLLSEEFSDIKNLDYTNLSASDIAVIEAFQDAIELLMIQRYEDSY